MTEVKYMYSVSNEIAIHGWRNDFSDRILLWRFYDGHGDLYNSIFYLDMYE